MSSSTAFSYTEPTIVTILILSSFLLLANVVNFLLDRTIYCGLIGQIFIGVAWGEPGAQWLSVEVQNVVMQLGYLGLVLIVYEGGLATNIAALKRNLCLSAFVALTGISAPIALSFLLMKVMAVTPLQAFAAGAALCSTSLGTTFTILSTTGLADTRLGIILSSAAMLDDVVGLIMVQVISVLGTSGSGDFDAITVIRPVFVSLAFAVVVPLGCRFLVQPLQSMWSRWTMRWQGDGIAQAVAKSSRTAMAMHTLVLVVFVTGSSYAGTSNLFAAYLAGAVVTWVDGLPMEPLPERKRTEKVEGTPRSEANVSLQEVAGTKGPANGGSSSSRPPHGSEQKCQPDQRQAPVPISLGNQPSVTSGKAIFEDYYGEAVNRILKPFFFLFCGLWLVRFAGLPNLPHPLAPLRVIAKVFGLSREKPQNKKGKEARQAPPSPVSAVGSDDVALVSLQSSPATKNAIRRRGSRPETISSLSAANLPSSSTSRIPKPLSLYPPAILGAAMIARGEIGFLISSLAESTGVFADSTTGTGDSSELFLVVTWAVLLCTIIGPLVVGLLVKRVRRLQRLERETRSGRDDPLGIWGVTPEPQ